MSNNVHPIFQPILDAICPPSASLLGKTASAPQLVIEELCACGKLVCERDEFQERCEECLQTQEQNQAEAAYERSQEEPCFRGGEYEAHFAAEQEKARRLK